MARLTSFLLLILALVCNGGAVLAQIKPVQPPAKAALPDLKPGDKLEVIDMGRLREAEFVEFTPVGLIKVRFEDDSQMAFRPTHVRFAQGANPRAGKAPAGRQPAPLPRSKNDAIVIPAAPPPDELKINRKWQDASGQFSIEAEFVTLQEGKVELKKPDGKIISVPLDKLAKADQEIARKLMTAANPFEADVAAAPPPRIEMKPLSVTLAGAQAVVYTEGVTWSPAVDPAPTIKNIPTAPLFVPSLEGYSINGTPLFDTGNGWTWFYMRSIREDKAYLERIDMLGRRQLARIPIAHNSHVFSVSPSGKWLAVRLNELFNSNRPTELQLWKVDGQDVQPAIKIAPFQRDIDVLYGRGFEANKHDYISNADFIDDRHLFVSTPNGSVLLDVETGKSVYTIVSSRAEFSPNKRYFVAEVYQHRGPAGSVLKRGFFVIESLTGRLVGELDLSAGGDKPSDFAFRSDGEKLAALGGSTIWVWDLQTGERETLWRGVDFRDRGAIAFGSHDHLIISGKYCFSLRDGVMGSYIWWTGQGPKVLADFQGRTWYYNQSEDRNANGVGIAALHVPGDALHKAYSEADLSDLLVIKPGSNFNLTFQGLPPEMAADFRAKHAAEFKEKGWKLVEPGEPADFDVTYTIENAPAVERTYLPTRDPSNPVKVMTYPQTLTMQLKKRGDDKVLWSRRGSFEARPNGYLQNNETVEQAALLIRNWTFFEKSQIPQRMMKYPTGVGAILEARLDSQGRLEVKKRNQ